MGFTSNLAGTAEPFRIARPEDVGLGRTKEIDQIILNNLPGPDHYWTGMEGHLFQEEDLA